MKVNETGWLVPESGESTIVWLPTVRKCDLYVPAPLGITWHWTGGTCGPHYAEKLCQSIQRYRQGVDRAASWHVMISKQGEVFQSVSFLHGSWHVGVPAVILGKHFPNVNYALIGLELENAGILLPDMAHRYYCWPYYGEPAYPEARRKFATAYEVPSNRAKYVNGAGSFDEFPPAQVEMATRVLRALVTAYGWPREACAFGHHDFDPVRKDDPGALWQQMIMPRILEDIFGK
jgi:N-acetyl-anhydromuramyl-L-alanine amidase AmpD